MTDKQAEARGYAAEGMQALQRRDAKGAEAALAKAIALDWPGPDIWVALSFAKSLQGDMAGRISAIEKALEIEPASVRARLHLGQALVGSGRGKEAEAEFRQGLAGVTPELKRNPEINQLTHAAEAYLAHLEKLRETWGEAVRIAETEAKATAAGG